MKALKFAALAVLLLAAPALGASVVLTGNNGQTFALEYNGIIDVGGVPTVMPGLSARVDFTVINRYYDSSINRTIVELGVVVSNTTDGSVWQNATVTGIGFNTDPNVRSVGTGATGAYGYVALNTSLPTSAGFMVEVCVSGRVNQCAGSPSGATQIGQITNTSVRLAFFGNVTSPITLDNFGIRYSASLSSGLGIAGEVPGVGVGTLIPPIPEPTSAAVLGLGALVVAAALRRRRAS